jgi:hypothetical protein
MYINRLQEIGHKAVGMAIDHVVEGLGVEAGCGKRLFFSRPSRKSLGLTQPVDWIPGHFFRVK